MIALLYPANPGRAWKRLAFYFLIAALVAAFEPSLFAQTNTNLVVVTPITTASTPNIPNTTSSALRVFGALIFVIALFLGGVWMFRNWQRMSGNKSGVKPKLQLLEVKSLGTRQSIYVIGYQQQRMLLASSPAGITLLSHLPNSEEAESATATPARMSFADALQQVLHRKSQ